MLARIRPDLGSWVPIPAGPSFMGIKNKKAIIEQPFCMPNTRLQICNSASLLKPAAMIKKDTGSVEGWLWRTGAYDTRATDESF